MIGGFLFYIIFINMKLILTEEQYFKIFEDVKPSDKAMVNYCL
jgi:hypothetical protein